MSAGDDRYARRSVTLPPDAEAALERLHERFGKSYSELVALGLLSLEANHRLLRHALAQPLNALRLTTGLLAAQHPDDVDLHAQIAAAFRQIEALLAPPVVKPAKT